MLTLLDRREPDGYDQFPRSAGEDAGDRGAAGEEDSEEGSRAVLPSPGLQHLRAAGFHRL